MNASIRVAPLCIIMGVCMGSWRTVHASDAQSSSSALRQQKLDVAQKWLEAATMNQGGPADYDHVVPAIRAVKDAQYELAKTRQERIAALREYRNRLDSFYKKIDGLYQSQSPGGEARRRAEIHYHLLDATLRLKDAEGQ